MINLEKETELLFTYCEEANRISQNIDMVSQKKYIAKIQKQAKDVFMYIENAVYTQSFESLYKHKETLVKLSFVILKSVYLFNNRYPIVPMNYMAYSLMYKNNYLSKFGNEGTWVKNDDIFKRALMVAFKGARPDFMAKVIESCINMLSSPMIYNQTTPDYMNRYIYHLRSAYAELSECAV